MSKNLLTSLWDDVDSPTMKTIPPFPAKGQSVKHPNLERNILIVGVIAAFALGYFVIWAINQMPAVGHTIAPSPTPTAQEQFDADARQLRGQAIEKARKN